MTIAPLATEVDGDVRPLPNSKVKPDVGRQRCLCVDVVGVCLSFVPTSQRSCTKALAHFRRVSSAWDAAFGHFLELFVIPRQVRPSSTRASLGDPHGMTCLTAEEASTSRDASAKLDSVWCPDSVSVLKHVLLQVGNGLTDRFHEEWLTGIAGVQSTWFVDDRLRELWPRLEAVRTVHWSLPPAFALHNVGTQVARCFPLLTTLTLWGVPLYDHELELFSELPNLTELDLSWCSKLVTFSALRHWPKLQRIKLSATAITPLVLSSHLATFPDLTALELNNCPPLSIADVLSYMYHLPKLQTLSLSGNSLNGTNLAAQHLGSAKRPSSRLAAVQNLDLSFCHFPNEADAAALWQHCSALIGLDLSYSVGLTAASLSPLKQHSLSLVHLNLKECRWLTDHDMKCVAELRCLRFLSVARCVYLTDNAFYHLRPLSRVEVLDIEYCNITTAAVRNLLQWKMLRRLQLCGTLVANDLADILPALAALGLVVIDVRYCCRIDVAQWEADRQTELSRGILVFS